MIKGRVHGSRFRVLEDPEHARRSGFCPALHDEFPSLLPEPESIADPVARRAFLRLMGASLALAGVTACGSRRKEIFP
jgi:hypothetical protein